MPVDPISAEARAVEAGAHAIRNEDGTFTVRSFSRPGLRHTIRVGLVVQTEGPPATYAVHLGCTCEAGTSRPAALVPCQHAALVGRRLERIGWARWSSGVWWPTDQALEAAGVKEPAPKPALREMRGACPICRAFVTVEIAGDDPRLPSDVAAEHRPECHEKNVARRAEAERNATNVDLWESSRGSLYRPKTNEGGTMKTGTDRDARLARLEELLKVCGVWPSDVMRELRREKRTRGRFLHELDDEALDYAIADAERVARKMGRIE